MNPSWAWYPTHITWSSGSESNGGAVPDGTRTYIETIDTGCLYPAWRPPHKDQYGDLFWRRASRQHTWHMGIDINKEIKAKQIKEWKRRPRYRVYWTWGGDTASGGHYHHRLRRGSSYWLIALIASNKVHCKSSVPLTKKASDVTIWLATVRDAHPSVGRPCSPSMCS
jgi:hypothetical protein